MKKPLFWPKNPYPASIFPMPEEQYLEIVPDPELRTALSGMLGRRFWDIASEAIWAAMSAGNLLCDDCELDDWCTTQPFTPACDIERAWAIYIRGVEEKVSEDEWTEAWPVEPGHYWFFGWCSDTLCRYQEAKMVLVKVSKMMNSIAYVGDGRFIYKDAVGLWKKAVLPEPPVIGVPFAEEER